MCWNAPTQIKDFKEQRRLGNLFCNECWELIERISTARPLLIDYFLGWNETLRSIGKLMIAGVILECEANSINLNAKRRDDWYRFVVHKIVSGCNASADIFKNKVHFVTFNYDVSLEYHLYRALSSIDLFNSADVMNFIRDERIIHVYGSVNEEMPVDAVVDHLTAQNLGDAFVSPISHEKEFGVRKEFPDQCFIASKAIRTIDPHEKVANEVALKKVSEWVNNAGVVYILGYGFDDVNSRRIGIDKTLFLNLGQPGAKVIMFTNFENRNTINKKASRLLFRKHAEFLDRSALGDPLTKYAEKSIRDVYGALQMDFDPLDEMLTGSTDI